MACSTMRSGCTEQTTAVSWKYEVSAGEPLDPTDPIINYICVPTTEELKKKIISTIKPYLHDLQNQSVLVQYWAAAKVTGKKVVVLTTTCQPFGLSGNNEKLQAYRKDCLDHKLYVFRDDKKETAFGLAGRAYLYGTPQQTQTRQNYPPKELCENTIFSNKWGSFAVPVFHANECVGVLDFVMDTPKHSYDRDIKIVQSLLQHVDLQTSVQNIVDCTKRSYVHPKERKRETFTTPITEYSCLVKVFGLSMTRAAKKLEPLIGHQLGETTFRNLCRNVGIPVWPCTDRASYHVPAGTQTVSETTPNADHLQISISYVHHLKIQISHNNSFNSSVLEQTTTIAVDLFPELVVGNYGFTGEMEYHSNTAQDIIMGNLDSMCDKEMIIADHLNSISCDQVFPESSVEQSMINTDDDSVARSLEPARRANLGEFMELYGDSIYDEDMNYAVLNSIKDKGFSEQQTKPAWIEHESTRSNFMAGYFDEMETLLLGPSMEDLINSMYY